MDSPRNILLLDWDGTLTCHSTVPLIAAIRPDAPSLAPFTAAYEKDLAQHSTEWQNVADTEADERAYYDSLAAVERASIQRLEAAGIWKSTTGPAIQLADGAILTTTAARGAVTDVEQHARKAVASRLVELRPGATVLIRRALRRREPVVIISVAWSGCWIAACLMAMDIPAVSAAAVPSSSGAAPPLEELVIVVANEIDPAGSARLSRGWAYPGGERTNITFDDCGVDGLWTSAHKLAAAQAWCQSLAQGKETRVIYLGDSLGDLHMLQSANMGIVVVDEDRTTEQRELEAVLRSRGWEIVDIDRETCQFQQPQSKPEGDRILWRVTGNLQPVLKLIYGDGDGNDEHA